MMTTSTEGREAGNIEARTRIEWIVMAKDALAKMQDEYARVCKTTWFWQEPRRFLRWSMNNLSRRIADAEGRP